jgi:hypothetical protein
VAVPSCIGGPVGQSADSNEAAEGGIKMQKLLVLLLILGLIGLATAAPVRSGDTRTEGVQFPKGEIGATIKGRIRGYETVDYKLRTRAGQGMIARLETDNLSNYIRCPGTG